MRIPEIPRFHFFPTTARYLLTTAVFSYASTAGVAAATAANNDQPVHLAEVIVFGTRADVPVGTETSFNGELAKALAPVSNNSLLRLMPGVTGGLGNKDRFGSPVAIRGGITWGIAETVDGYPTIDVVPVAAEDGGYTAGLSTIIPSIALSSLSVATGGLGVDFGQATGGVIRSQIKRGNPGNPFSAAQAEYNTVGESLVMAESSGGTGRLDYYTALQTLQGDYGDNYASASRPLEKVNLYSALAKVGYTFAIGGRLELLTVAGREDHQYYQVKSGKRIDYGTDKDNAFMGVRYDHNTGPGVHWEMGGTLNRFHENRINQETSLSERNRPQRAAKLFANVYNQHQAGHSWRWSAAHGVEIGDDSFRDITGPEKRFEFGELGAYTRHKVVWRDAITLSLGLRAARVDNGFREVDQLAHSAGIAVATPGGGTLRASHSTGYRLNKAFYLFWGGGSNINRAPFRGLDPSESESWETSYTHPFKLAEGTGSVRVTYFESTESRLFNFGNSGTGTPYYDEGLAQGVEAWTEWSSSPQFRLFAGYASISNRRENSTNPNAANLGLRFSPLPAATASIGFQRRLGKSWEITAAGLYDAGSIREFYDDGMRETEQFNSFFKVDASIAWRATKSLVTFLRVENLLNDRDLGYTAVREHSDGTTTENNAVQRDPGILFSLGARWEF